jgi:tRNA U34 5-carboxymethylaminomethyl modifying GTPase MnmE/TrmE
MAGLWAAEHPIEAEGVARARQNIATADLAIFVADVTAPWDVDFHDEITNLASAGRLPGQRTLIVHNKCDLAPPPNDGRPAGLEVSAKSGQGISELCEAIARTLVPEPPRCGAGMPFTNEQTAAIQAAADHLVRGDLMAAQQQMRSLLSVR